MTLAITRDEIMARATMAPWLPETVEYDMEVSAEFPTGADCSAYITYCWNVSGDYNTVTLLSAGIMEEIPFSDVQRGDAMGHCGPNTGGAGGHIQLFDRWEDLNAGTYWCWQQNGVGLGPHYDLESLPDNYRAYRYRGVGDASTKKGSPMLIRSGDTDVSIYYVPGGILPSGKVAAYAVYPPVLEALQAAMPTVQLPPGVSVSATGVFDVSPAPWSAGSADHQHVTGGPVPHSAA